MTQSRKAKLQGLLDAVNKWEFPGDAPAILQALIAECDAIKPPDPRR